jgi:branched-chain amino acid transport system permease protein
MTPESISFKSPRFLIPALLVVGLLCVPMVATWLEQSFYLTFATRIVIFAIATSGLNLMLGYGGLVSLGHALYIGLGAYVVAIAGFHGMTNGWVQLLLAVALSALVSALTGLVSLRTRGMSFIMITLAFGQMFYFLAVSMKRYGGDDGLSVDSRSEFPPLPSLDSRVTLYYTALVVLLLVMYGVWRTAHGRFGYVLRGFRVNERRMLGAGFPRLRYQLTAYMVSAIICAVAGVLMANQTSFSSPSYLSWQASGELILMVVLGGMGTVVGPLLGSIVLLVLEETLSGMTQHWMVILGPIILLVALLANRGIWGAALQWFANRATHNQDAQA